VALALGPCKQPLPAFRHAVYPFDGQYGQIGHNIELIKAMGPVRGLVVLVLRQRSICCCDAIIVTVTESEQLMI
jgi:hypothetical protein